MTLLIAAGFTLSAQNNTKDIMVVGDTLTVVYYNLLDYPTTDPTRWQYYKTIFHDIMPDIIVVNELETTQGADLILTNALNSSGITGYSRAVFHDGPDTDNLLFYNSNKLGLVSQEQIPTTLRDISRYKMYYKSADLATDHDTIFLNVFGWHLKASQGYESDRLGEVTTFFNYIQAHAPVENIIVGGDCNFYGVSSEPAYTYVVSNSVEPLADPETAGEWHDNASFVALHTQSTKISGGGMDDRFDFTFYDNEIISGTNRVLYVDGSYHAYGNDGTGNTFNNSINAVASTQYSGTILDALFNGSDHLPVVSQIIVSDSVSSFSPYAEILSFTMPQQTGPATINSSNATVHIEVSIGTALTSLTPTITVSPGATINPASGVARNFTTPQTYTVTAGNGTTKVWTVTVTVEDTSLLSIYDIQYTSNVSGNSPYMNQVVTIKGVVTALHYSYQGGTYRGYFIQEAQGPWHGIYVYNNTNTPVTGSEIKITGTVSEYNNLTEISNVTSYLVTNPASVQPASIVIESGDMGEEFEGVLITVYNALCTVMPDGYNVWTVNSNSTGPLSVDDDIFQFVPTLNETYDITGIGHYSYSLFKILPRDMNDVTISTDIPDEAGQSQTIVYPNPFSDILHINGNSGCSVSVYNILGEKIIDNYIVLPGKLDCSSLLQGVYILRVTDSNGNSYNTRIFKK